MVVVYVVVTTVVLVAGANENWPMVACAFRDFGRLRAPWPRSLADMVSSECVCEVWRRRVYRLPYVRMSTSEGGCACTCVRPCCCRAGDASPGGKGRVDAAVKLGRVMERQERAGESFTVGPRSCRQPRVAERGWPRRGG